MVAERSLIIESVCHISVDTGRLLFKRSDGVSRTELASELSALCLHHEQITISHHALRLLSEAGTALIVTDAQHMPCATLLANSTEASAVAVIRLHQQINFGHSAEHKAQVWQQLVSQKIANSAYVLRALQCKGALRLERLAQEVAPGDSKHAEGQAAKLYWANYLNLPAFLALEDAHTQRQKQGAQDPVNSRLNYGYAVMRAIIARELAMAGLNPILGLGHHNQGNPNNLVDDLIEPYRAIVDWSVARLADKSDLNLSFSGKAKQDLLHMLQCEVTLSGAGSTRYRLATAVGETVQSYAHLLGAASGLGGKNKLPLLKLPISWRETDDDV